MEKSTLRKYLFGKRIELYEQIDELKDHILSNTFTEREYTELEIAEAQLVIIKEIITICNNRNKYWIKFKRRIKLLWITQ